MEFKDRTRSALKIAVLVWGGSLAALTVAGLVTDVWRLSDLWGQAGAVFLSEFGILVVVGTFLLIGGPIFLRERYELIAPIIGLACYVAYWSFLGVTTGAGVSALYALSCTDCMHPLESQYSRFLSGRYGRFVNNDRNQSVRILRDLKSLMVREQL